MIDTIVALAIFALIVIPAAGVIAFAYSAGAGSADVSRQFNDFRDTVDRLILAHALDGEDLGNYSGNNVEIFGNGVSIDVRLMVESADLTTGNRRVPVRVYMIQK